MEATINWILTNQQIPETLCPELLYDVIWALMYCVALRLNPCDVTQQATWRPPCGVRRMIQKRSQFYTKKSNVSRIFLYGLSMWSSPNLHIHLLCVFFSFKTRQYMRPYSWRMKEINGINRLNDWYYSSRDLRSRSDEWVWPWPSTGEECERGRCPTPT